MSRLALLTLILISQLKTASYAQQVQRVNPDDSIRIRKVIEGFYQWYAEQIKNGSKNIMQSFIRRGDGMTTLDFGAYRLALSAHGFSNSFFERRNK